MSVASYLLMSMVNGINPGGRRERDMKEEIQATSNFEPEIYCLVCQHMEWDDEERRCANFDGANCPLTIRRVLAGLDMSCLVV